ncbi:glutamine--fructose-6-phosphate transaminase (isomerizing) [Endozoicomonas sp.]|nr:glutamine--fructose-6-phosphate transaminase (isomerizing) [Endozoicomonas sp.]
MANYLDLKRLERSLTMCGIVGAVAQRDVAPILIEGLRRLEYRGYDSAGVAVIQNDGGMNRLRRTGKVALLGNVIKESPVHGGTGIAHTRWATHGAPSERNAHPHVSGENIAVVHNGIIENHEILRGFLTQEGYSFSSDTDTEVIAHLVNHEMKKSQSLIEAVQKAVRQLEGAYGMVVMDREDLERLIVARSGSPLVIGVGIDEHFVASDPLALFPVTRRFVFLEEGDVAEVTRTAVSIVDIDGHAVERQAKDSDVEHDAGDKGQYRHYMLKEIHEQPDAIANTLEGRLGECTLNLASLGSKEAAAILEKTRCVQIVACGTSYHAGMVARYWFEELAGIPCRIEIASEFRYRKFFMPEAAYDLVFAGDWDHNSTTVRLHCDSPTSPDKVLALDLTTRQMTQLHIKEIPNFNPNRYIVKRELATARDGKVIPVTLVHKKDLKQDGANKALVYGYGSYGYGIPAYFSSKIFSLIDRGFVYAIAHIRGGDDKGYAWYLDGKMHHKMNTFYDFIDCCEYLIEQNYTTKQLISINGGSAGGLLMGAVTNLRPDLFGSVIADVAFVDVINTISDETLPLTPPEWEEWGNPIKSKEDFEYIQQYSPYDNVQKKAYPPMLFNSGIGDEQVTYWEPTKMVAKLRELKTDDNMLLLNMKMHAGHAGASKRYEWIEEAAFDYAFILKSFGMK